MATYKARVRPGNKGASVEVTIEARNTQDARRILEGQHGKGSVVGSPRLQR